MLRERAKLISAAQVGVETALAVPALWAAHVLRQWLSSTFTGAPMGPPFGPFETFRPLLPLLVLAVPLAYWLAGLYRSFRTSRLHEEIGRIGAAPVLLFLVLAALIYAFRVQPPSSSGSSHISRSLVAIFCILHGLSVLALRVTVRLALHQIRRKSFNTRNLLIVGTGRRGRRVAEEVELHEGWGLRVLGFVGTGRYAPDAQVKSRWKLMGSAANLPSLLREYVVDEVIFALSRRQLDGLEPMFTLCRRLGIPTRIYADVFPEGMDRVVLDQLGDLPLITFDTTRQSELAAALCRVFDLVVSGIGLVLASPIFVAAGIAVKMSSPGTVFFRQMRVGKNGRRFPLYKFRTMVKDAESRKASLAHLNEMDGPVFKIKNDPRVTRVGKFLRQWSIDELPQLWNVFKGDMAIVGPRPPTPDEVKTYSPYERRRLSVRPGITCLWQVSGRNDVSFQDWMKLDLEYIDNWSFWLDLKILALTVPAVLGRKGAR